MRRVTDRSDGSAADVAIRTSDMVRQSLSPTGRPIFSDPCLVLSYRVLPSYDGGPFRFALLSGGSGGHWFVGVVFLDFLLSRFSLIYFFLLLSDGSCW